jgi:hypothetical protein
MAKNKIEIDVKVDDKGTTKKVALGAKQAAEGLDKTAKSARTTDRNLKGASQQSANGTKNFSKMAQGISGGLVPAYATLAANVFALTAAFQFLKDSADFRVIKDSQIAFSSATGIGLRTLTADIKAAADGLIGFKEAASAAAIGTAAGLSTQQIELFARGAKDVSLILGRDVTDSFNRLIRGVTKAEPELLDELGIILRLTTATEKYAATLNKSVKDLTLFEKSQSVAVEVQDQLDKKYSTVAASVKLQANEMAKLGVAFEKVINPIKEFIALIGEPIAKFFANNIQALTGALILFALPITKAIIPGLEDWAESSKLAARTSLKEYAIVKKEIAELDAAQKQLAASANANVAAQQALQGVTSRSTGIKKLQTGDFSALSKKEINGLLVAAEKGKGAVTQMSKQMKTQYIAALRAMKAESTKTFATIGTRVKAMTTTIQIQTKKMVATWQLAMAKMKTATAKFARGVDKIMKGLGIIGIALLIKDLAVQGLQAAGIGVQSKEAQKLGDELESLTNKLEDSTEQFKLFTQIQEEYYKKNTGGATLEGVAALGGFIDTQGNIFASIAESFDRVTEAGKNIDINPNALQELGFGYSNISEAVEDLNTKSSVAAKQMAEGLKAAKVEVQPFGAELLDLLETIGKNGIQVLSEEQLSRFKELVKEGAEAGQKARLLQEQETSINQAYRTRIASITKYQTSVSSLISEIKQTLKQEEEINSANEERIKQYERQLEVLKQIRANEIKFANEQLAIENRRLRAKTTESGFGVTPLVAAQQDREFNVEQAQSLYNQALQEIDLAKRLAKNDGVSLDPDKLYQLELAADKAYLGLAGAKNELSEVYRIGTAVADTFETSMVSAIDGMIQGTMSLKEAFASVAMSILQMISKMIAEMIAFKIVSGIMGAVMGGPSAQSLGQVSSTGQAAGLYGSVTPLGKRYGGVVANGREMPGYAVGGIAKGPDAGYPVTLHGTEAVVPLPNGKSIPVDMKGAGQNNNVVVNVSVDNQGNAQTSTQSQSGADAGNLGSAIARAVQQELQNQKRSGGILNPYGVA